MCVGREGRGEMGREGEVSGGRGRALGLNYAEETSEEFESLG